MRFARAWLPIFVSGCLLSWATASPAVVSGINAGANAGRATLISGTVGAAISALRMHPALPPERIKGVANARQGSEFVFRLFAREASPGVFTPGFEVLDIPHDVADSDAVLLDQGYVTIVPLDADFTAGPAEAGEVVPRMVDLAP